MDRTDRREHALVSEDLDYFVNDEMDGGLISGIDLSRECFFFFQAEDGIRDLTVTGVQTCALPICGRKSGRIPMPLSRTTICTAPPSRDNSSSITPPEGVNFTALFNRFDTTC